LETEISLDAVELWLSNLRADSTRYKYDLYFGRFLDYVQRVNPSGDEVRVDTVSRIRELGYDEICGDAVLELRRRDLQTFKLSERLRFETLARKWMRTLEDRDTGYSLRCLCLASVKSFFVFADMPLQLTRKDAPQGEYETEVRPVTKSEIRAMLGVSDYYEKAVLLVMKSTGLGVSDLAAVRVSNLGHQGSWRDWLVKDDAPIPVRGKRIKTKKKFHTFLDSEAAEALRTYWLQREKGTQYLDSNRKRNAGVPPNMVTAKSRVFLQKQSLNLCYGKYFSVMVRTIVQKANLKGISAHSFRRFFQTTLESPELGIEANWIRRMMGHKVKKRWDDLGFKPSTHGSYSYPEAERLRKAFEGAMPALSVYRHIDLERLRILEEADEDKARTIDEQKARIDRFERILAAMADQMQAGKD